MSINYYILDTETNGVKSNYHEVVEIGIVRCTDRMQFYKKIKCENPERSSVDALNITGKTLADLLIGDSKESVIESANNFFEEDGSSPAGRCIIAHNAQFDKKFIHALWESVGKEFPASLWLDTIKLTDEFIKNADLSNIKVAKTATGKISKKLHDCCDLLGVNKFADAHNAKVDSRNTYLLWQKLLEKKVDFLPHIKTFSHLIRKQEDVDDLIKELEDY